MSKEIGVNPWLSIWVKPRETVAKIVAFNPKHRFLLLSFLYGLPMLLNIVQNLSLGDLYGMTGIVIAAVVLATFAGMLAITVASALLLWTGKWIGGQGNYQSIRAAVAWSNVPNILLVLTWVVLLFLFREQVLVDSYEEMDFVGQEFMVASIALAVQSILGIWSFVILVKGLGQVQKFSAWKGVLNVLIPFFLIGLVIWVVSWLVWVSLGVVGM